MLKSLGLWDVDLEVTRFEEESEKDKLSTKSEPNLIIDKQTKNKLELENQELRKRKLDLDTTSQQLDQQVATGISKISLNQPFEKEDKQHTYYFAFFLPFHNFFCQLFRLSEYRIAKGEYF